MSKIAIPLPVSVEQIAVAIQQMSPAELERLLALVPELSSRAKQVSVRRSESQVQNQAEDVAAVEAVRAWVMNTLDHNPLTSDAPFFDGLTLGEYLTLPDEKQAELWDKWEGTALYDMEESEIAETEVVADAVPA